MNNFKNSITKLSNLFSTNSSEEAQYLSKVLDAKVWKNYAGAVTKTTSTITTNIAGITANPFGLLTNVILSPEGISFFIAATPKMLINHVRSIATVAKSVLKKFRRTDAEKEANEQKIEQYKKLKAKAEELRKLANEAEKNNALDAEAKRKAVEEAEAAEEEAYKNKPDKLTVVKQIIRPYVGIYIDLIKLVYTKDIYQPFIEPIINLIINFPLFTEKIRNAFKQLYSIYLPDTIKTILNQSIEVILNERDKIKKIFALYYNLLTTIFGNITKIIETFISEVKNIANSAKDILVNAAVNAGKNYANEVMQKIDNSVADKINNLTSDVKNNISKINTEINKNDLSDFNKLSSESIKVVSEKIGKFTGESKNVSENIDTLAVDEMEGKVNESNKVDEKTLTGGFMFKVLPKNYFDEMYYF